MVVNQGDLIWVLSGGPTGASNTNPFNSYGGEVTNTVIVNDTMNNLWDDPNPADVQALGVTDYRAIYLVNKSTSDDATQVKIFWPVKSSFMSAEVNRKGPGNLCTLLTNSKFTPPVSEIGDPTASPQPFTRDTDSYDTSNLIIGTIPKNGGSVGIWIRRQIPVNQSSNNDILSELRAGLGTTDTGGGGTTPPPPPPPPGPGGNMIYQAKVNGYVYDNGDESGGMCEGDGIRLNLTNYKNTIVNHETTWRNIKFTSNPRSCTDKPWFSPKSGTHDHSDNSCILIECSFTYDGDIKGARTERGNKNYQSCSGLQKFNNPPNINTGSIINMKYCTWVTGSPLHEYHQWWLAEGQDSTNYKLLAMLVDGNPNQCQQPPIGITGTYTGPQVELADTFRANGATITYGKYDLVEIEIPSQPKQNMVDAMTTEALDASTTIIADTEEATYDCNDCWSL